MTCKTYTPAMLIVWKAPCVRMERIGRQSRHHDRLTERIAVWATVPPSRVPEEPEILATYWRGPIEPRHFYITTDVYIPKAKRPRWRKKKKRERIKTVLQSQCLPSTNSHDRPGSRRNRIAGVLFQEGWKVGNFIYIFLLSLKANEDSIWSTRRSPDSCDQKFMVSIQWGSSHFPNRRD